MRIKLAKIWYDEDDFCSEDEFVKLCNGYKNIKKKEISKFVTFSMEPFLLMQLVYAGGQENERENLWKDD